MAKAIMIQGTTSHAGKSLLAAGLCRILRQDGVRVAPFKSQNMALNSHVTANGLEMGRAQVVQAQCAGVAPDVRMNPILLKPNSDTGSQVIVNGEVVGNMRAQEYFAFKHTLVPTIQRAYDSLAAEYDVIVLEGAGSPAEINLMDGDIVNMGMARMANAPVLLVGDINPGGVFAALTGTLQLLYPEDQKLLKGVIINKFRGDRAILQPGLDKLEHIMNRPVLGVVPWLQIDIDDEDSMSDRFTAAVSPALIDIAVIRLPRLSNFTDFAPLAAMEEVNVRYVSSVRELDNPDLIILPGTKSTMADLLWLRQCGLEAKIQSHAAAGRPVLGICGGYQMLGEMLCDPDCIESGGDMQGMGLLPMQTVFETHKRRRLVEGTIHVAEGCFSALKGCPFTGYEIHMGATIALQDAVVFCEIQAKDGSVLLDGQVKNNVCGCYVHGLFDLPEISQALVKMLLQQKGLSGVQPQPVNMEQYRETQYDLLAAGLRQALDMKRIYNIIEQGL